ncbi:MAG: hydroxylamine oxidase [Syntrophobacterales bacterium]|nr:hydroxylamine oxidase [Syntrophobacterales bacterium]
MKKRHTVIFWILLMSVSILVFSAQSGAAALSEATKTCLGCHENVTPGIVSDWQKSHHATVTPAEAIKKPLLERRVSFKDQPRGLETIFVGCAECHALNPDAHKDTFNHNGFKVHIVVTPGDCATCHPQETDEYSRNIMSEAHGNLLKNPVYKSLMDAANSLQKFDGAHARLTSVDKLTEEDSCIYCHGTKVEVTGSRSRETAMGEMEFPVLSGWPSGGVGRINPDGTKGACSACHTRHAFSIEMARKPATCSACHKGPDVPAYKVYQASKHGNLYESTGDKWNFGAVPWTLGKDFTAPTCATCHASLLVNEAGDVVAKRSHQMNDRSPWRLFGLIYAHPHPLSPDTTIIRNKAGLPLPTELTGEAAAVYLIDKKEQEKRRASLQTICLQCHATSWVDGHFARLEKSIETTNQMTRTATDIILSAWEKGLAQGLAKNDSIFNEAIERMWVEQWLFYANSTRFASAMGGADYGVFANGRWYMSKNIQQMSDWLHFLEATHAAGKNGKIKKDKK